jgi:hypothetical protein
MKNYKSFKHENNTLTVKVSEPYFIRDIYKTAVHILYGNTLCYGYCIGDETELDDKDIDYFLAKLRWL